MADTDTFTLEVATPDRLLFHEEATEAQIPALDGFIGVLPGHAPLLSELARGAMTYVSQGKVFGVAVYGGFVEVLPNHVRVLADGAERAEEIDTAAAQRELQAAEENLRESSSKAESDPAAALDAMQHAQARVDAVKSATAH